MATQEPTFNNYFAISRKGSIIVTYILAFEPDSDITEDVLLDIYGKATKNNTKIADYVLDPKFVTIKGMCFCFKQNIKSITAIIMLLFVNCSCISVLEKKETIKEKGKTRQWNNNHNFHMNSVNL